ncbi:alpha/beta fold hydrolase [Actinomadura rayongensis]|uniref:Serine aminopeptidase S33 domain-containing protein n=1 Tax=Actinomadura rayongensis TaxID=1429076 RepID=A0A6I4WDT6_9ACTN|nr:alpha/beta hydrolase [Actinomadura rayongensis]MXQ67841.1 hypothetical protein [Actinomadura rayongensis]
MPTELIRGRRVRYEVHGAGEPVLAIGGWGLATGNGFANHPAVLRDAYRFVVYDHRGLGGSGDDDRPGSTELYADDAADLADHLGLGPVHVLGTGGMGACVAQHLAVRRPGLVHDLVLSAGWAGPEPYHHAQQELMLLLRQLDDPLPYRLFGSLLTVAPERFTAETVTASARHQAGGMLDRRDAHLKLVRANLEHDARALLGRIACPTLVVCGERDQLGAPRLARELAGLIDGAELVVVPGATHVFRDDPEAHRFYGETVAAFFDRHRLPV